MPRSGRRSRRCRTIIGSPRRLLELCFRNWFTRCPNTFRRPSQSLVLLVKPLNRRIREAPPRAGTLLPMSSVSLLCERMTIVITITMTMRKTAPALGLLQRVSWRCRSVHESCQYGLVGSRMCAVRSTLRNRAQRRRPALDDAGLPRPCRIVSWRRGNVVIERQDEHVRISQ